MRQIDLIVEREAHQGMTTEQIFTRIRTLRNVVLEMVAVLEAIKPIAPPGANYRRTTV